MTSNQHKWRSEMAKKEASTTPVSPPKARSEVLVVTYPPTFDGELHINATTGEHHIKYEFSYAKRPGEKAWDVLVKAARDILQQDRDLHQ